MFVMRHYFVTIDTIKAIQQDARNLVRWMASMQLDCDLLINIKHDGSCEYPDKLGIDLARTVARRVKSSAKHY